MREVDVGFVEDGGPLEGSSCLWGEGCGCQQERD